MADFGQGFKLTNVGQVLELKAQQGKVLNFTKFELGDGNYTGSIEDITALVNPIRSENIIRLNINTVSSTKHVQVGFNLNTSEITTGFYLREIGLYAEDPDTHEEILMYYGNAGDTADYIAPSTSTTVSEKLIDILIYISNAQNITAVIDSSMVYATESELTALTSVVNEKANSKKSVVITIPTTGWSGSAPYTQTISVTGIVSTDIPYLYPIYSDVLATRTTEQEEYAKITLISSNNGSITLTCDEEVPTIALNARVEVYY